MFAIGEYRDCLDRMATILRGQGVRFSLTGGAAFIAYGDPRTTQDVDLVVDAEQMKLCLPAFLSQTRGRGFLVNEPTVMESVRNQRQFQVIDRASTLKLDLYPRELIPGELARAIEIEVLPNLKLPVAARSDLLLSKLIWISKGSSKSRRDVKELMHRLSAAEIQTVRETADAASLLSLLEDVLAEPDEIDA